MKQFNVIILISGIYEFILGIPILGNTMIWEMHRYPMTVALILHASTLILAIQNKVTKIPSILALLSLTISWLPLIGWGIHWFVSATLLTSYLFRFKKLEGNDPE